MSFEIKKNFRNSTERSLYLDLYVNEEKEDFCVLKRGCLTRSFEPENEKTLGIKKNTDSISEYFKNPDIGKHYKEHFKNLEIKILSFTTDLKKVKFF